MDSRNRFFCKIVVTFFIVIWQCPTFAQQLPIFNQNRENLNPAFISADYFKFSLASNAGIRYRHQWTSLKGAPSTITGSFISYNEDLRFLFGGELVHDQTGPTGTTGLYGRAGYAFEFGRDLLMTVGLKAGLIQYRIKGTELNFLEEENFANADFMKLYPDFSLGAMLYYKKHYYIGFSVPQLLGLDLNFKEDSKDYRLTRVRHYYSILGARFDLGGGSWIEGSSELRYVHHVPFFFNVRVQFDYRDLFWIASNVSSAKEFSGEFGVMRYIGMNSNLLRIGYSFSNFFQPYGPHFGLVHEVGGTFSF